MLLNRILLSWVLVNLGISSARGDHPSLPIPPLAQHLSSDPHNA